MISFALPKGRLAEKTIGYLTERGICAEGVVDFSSRKLIFDDKENDIRFYLVRNADVATYVEHGVADFGVVGKDLLEETGAELYEYRDLGFGSCRLSVAAPVGKGAGYVHGIKVATTFTNVTKRFFAEKGIFVDVIKLYGSVEIAPLTSLSDYIVDLVESGETLRKNNLEEVETIMQSSARLVGNKRLARVKHREIKKILETVMG